MDPHDQEIAKAIRQYAALQEAEAERHLELSPDFTNQVLARIRHERSTLEKEKVQPDSDPASWFELLRASWRPFAVGSAALAVLLIFLGMQGYLDTGNSFTGLKDPLEREGTPNLLPLRLHVDFKTSKIVLRGNGIELSGALTPLVSESSSGTNVYQLDMGGKDSAGKIVTLTNGRAHFILKTPGGVIKGKEDTIRARLEGRLDVAGQGNYEVKRIYLP